MPDEIPSLAVDLREPPEERWRVLDVYAAEAARLLDCYLADLGGLARWEGLLLAYAAEHVQAEYAAEMAAVAARTGRTFPEVLAANLYYDLLKLAIGCTAFAVDTPDGPLHARNLDWWTQDALLSRHTLLVDYHRGSREPLCRVVGWPGFVGALSGVAPGRFAVTLNAVVSRDPPAAVPPVSLLLRQALESCPSYEDALELLASTPIPCDCLLLVTGTCRGEMAVVERTPTRSEVRYGESGFIAVTNHYRVLDGSGASGSGDPLLGTSCGRYDRAEQLARVDRPTSPEACFRILADAQVQMGITVQQMVFHPASGSADLRVPDHGSIQPA